MRGPVALPSVGCAVGAVVVGLMATVGSARQTFRSGVDLVHVPVVVRANPGTTVRGLVRGDFEVLENGRPQQIAYFAEGAPGEAVPLHLGLMLDKSGSMGQDLRAAADAAIKFVNTLDETTDVTFVDFDRNVRVGRFSPPSYPLLFERIRDRKADGYTSLYDAIGLYVQGALDREGQHVLLLYTDGGDSTSTITFGTLQRLLRLGNVLIYSIGYLEHESSSSARATQQMRLTQISAETGGEAFFPTSKKEIEGAYERILEDLQSRYTLGYVSGNRVPDGKFRKVEVKVNRLDLKGLKVRARSGYLAPQAPPVR
jgi:Ca-activated chloride channel family protein